MSSGMIFGVVFVGAFFALLSVAIALGGGVGREKQRRINAVRDRAFSLAAGSAAEARSLVRGEDEARGFERYLAGLLPRRAQLRLRLQRAGLAMTVGRYATISVAGAVVAVFLLDMIFGLPLALSLLTGLAFGVMAPHVAVSTMIAKRSSRFQQQFPEAIDLIVRGLKSGLPISETIANVGDEMDDTVGTEFRAVTDAVRLGATLDEALWEAARRIDLAEFRFFAISLSVQRETGGNLGETLANLADILRKRLTMKLKVKAMSSEARASAYIIGALPFVMFALFMVMNPSYESALIYDPRGIMMTTIGLIMIVVGAAVMFKLARFEV